jgi:hypothetical protein
MPPFPAESAGGADSSPSGVITELKAMPGNCAVPPSKKYCSPRCLPWSVRVISSVLSKGWNFGSSLWRNVDMSTDTSPLPDS